MHVVSFQLEHAANTGNSEGCQHVEQCKRVGEVSLLQFGNLTRKHTSIPTANTGPINVIEL